MALKSSDDGRPGGARFVCGAGGGRGEVRVPGPGRSDETREAYLGAMAAHVLDHGLAAASLRPLAEAAGTSDRMLVYHFGGKDRLIGEILARLAGEFASRLDAAIPEAPSESRRALLRDVLAHVRSPVLSAYVRVLREAAAEAGRGREPHLAIGSAALATRIGWLERRMPAVDPDPRRGAEAMLTLIEGIHAMDAVGHPDVADAAIAALYSEATA